MNRTVRLSRPASPRTRRRLALAAALAAVTLTAAGCSSSGSSSAARGATASPAGTNSAAQADVSNVTLHIGDQAGSQFAAQPAVTAGRDR